MSARVDVQVSDGADWLPLSRGRALPEHFTAIVDDPGSPYMIRAEVVVAAGSPGVRNLTVYQREEHYPPGPPVSSLRSVKVREILRLAVDAAARARTDLHNPRWPGAFTVEGLGDQVYGGPTAGRRPADGDRLDAAARAYRAAKAEGRPVREAVMQACGVASSQAARLIRAARAAGKIPPRDAAGPSPRDARALRQAGDITAAQAGAGREPEPDLPPRTVNLQTGEVRTHPPKDDTEGHAGTTDAAERRHD
jgi:hypothetical protein